MNLIKTKSFELAVISRGDENSKKLALALPGRLDTKDYWNFASHLEVLAQKGFFAVSFDPPGTWESPGGIELFTTTNYIKAVNEAIECFGNRQALLLGHSRGGATAALVAEQNPNVAALVTINESLGTPSPPDPGTVKDGFYIDHRDFPPGDKKTKKQKQFKVPLAYFEDGAKYNDAQALKRVKVPKLMFSSKKDEFTTPKEVENVFEALPAPKILHKLSGSHDYRYYPKVVEKVNKQMAKFIGNYF